MDFEKERLAFERVFANLPEKIRNADIIAVVDGKPYTWNAVYLEVKNDSALGRKILKRMKALRLL